MDEAQAPVIGVIGSAGGVGVSTLACALADAAGAGLLLDLDTCGGGLDVLLGVNAVAGVRWSGLRVAGGALDPVDLARGLPRWRGVPLLAADGVAPSLAAVRAVLDAGRRLGPVVLDAGRCLCPDARAVLASCSVVVLVTDSDRRGLAAVRATAGRLGARGPGPMPAAESGGRTTVTAPMGMVLRRGSIGRVEAEAVTGIPVLGTLAPLGRRDGIRLSRPLLRVAAGVLDGVLGE
ncbi:MAG TPA: hypothetical protein VGN35_11280 [Jatrophihabitantaceae bacterium]|nr:hypothetical protein [Jatrophihabitantaceae bacterium]